MTGTISFGGIGSGLDTEGIVTGLVDASKGPLSALKSKAAATHAAVSTLSDLSGLLAKLSSAVQALDEPNDVASYSASSSSSAISVSALGTAQPGAYSITVDELAKEQRTYTNTFASSTDPLNQSGTLSIQVGSGTAIPITVATGDSLDTLATKINQSGERVSASVFYDGSNYRLQVRGMDTGAANAVTFTETGTTLGLTDAANTKQAAQDSKVTIDGFTVTRSTNEVAGAIQGLTLTLTEKTTSPVTVRVDPSSDALQAKIQTLVTTYNDVIKKIQATAGYGSQTASNPVLAGDSMLRGLSNKLSSSFGSAVSGAGTYQTLGAIGLGVDKTGMLVLDTQKLSNAVAKDPQNVQNLFAGVTGDDGVMDIMKSAVETYTQTGTGIIASRNEGLEARAKSLDDSVDREQTRLDAYAEMLRKQFQSMDTQVAAFNSQLDYLSKISSG
ncbi:MAG: flagellar filament capping protein FliD [Myxococcales bacterium]|nr:flagellar filament capping protein FliD [Myxococcales bacterium]MCB9579360.1 flagellar filament capping protein FliD [Polyangiaceae bacterium]